VLYTWKLKSIPSSKRYDASSRLSALVLDRHPRVSRRTFLGTAADSLWLGRREMIRTVLDVAGDTRRGSVRCDDLAEHSLISLMLLILIGLVGAWLSADGGLGCLREHASCFDGGDTRDWRYHCTRAPRARESALTALRESRPQCSRSASPGHHRKGWLPH